MKLLIALDIISRTQDNIDSLGTKMDKAKIPNGWKILFERISSTHSISTNMSSITDMNKFVFCQGKAIEPGPFA